MRKLRSIHFSFPTAYTILFALTALVALGTWFVPAGQYERALNEELGRETPVPGTYARVDQDPQGIVDLLIAPVAGFYDPGAGTANAIDVALFVLVIGGFLGVVYKTNALNVGIGRLMQAMSGHQQWIIPILMAAFAAGGTTYGMAEETLAFYAILIPVMIAAGYDSSVAAAIILLGAGIGTLGSTINPFATVIASDAADIAFSEGIVLRFVLLALGWVACVLFVMRYAARVKRDPSQSLVADHRDEMAAQYAGGPEAETVERLTGRQMLVLVVFVATFLVMVWGVSSQGWWMAEMSALFLASALVTGVIAWINERDFADSFVNGARDLLGVAFIIGIARGIVVVMDAGKMTDTILHAAENLVSGLPSVVFVNGVFGVEVAMSFLVPSSSGLAVLSMPILAPLADFSGVERSLVVTAYQSASGLVNLITPTSAVVMGGLGIARVPYQRWLRFMWPLLVILTVIIVVGMSVATFVS